MKKMRTSRKTHNDDNNDNNDCEDQHWRSDKDALSSKRSTRASRSQISLNNDFEHVSHDHTDQEPPPLPKNNGRNEFFQRPPDNSAGNENAIDDEGSAVASDVTSVVSSGL